jgi:hypothetical protein
MGTSIIRVKQRIERENGEAERKRGREYGLWIKEVMARLSHVPRAWARGRRDSASCRRRCFGGVGQGARRHVDAVPIAIAPRPTDSPAAWTGGVSLSHRTRE